MIRKNPYMAKMRKKLRIAKMMKRDLGFQSESLAAEIKSEYKKIKQTKNIMLFNRCMDDML